MSLNMQGNASSKDDDEIDISQLFRQLWGHKWLILLITITCVVLGAAFAITRPPQYQADILLQIEDNRGSGEGLLSGDSAFLMGLGSKKNASSVESALIKSRFILAPVIQSLGLDIEINPKVSLKKRIFSSNTPQVKVTNLKVPRAEIEQPLLLKINEHGQVTLFNAKGNKVLSGKVGPLLVSNNKQYRIQIKSFPSNTTAEYHLKKLSMTNVLKSLTERISIENLGDKKTDNGLLSILLKGTNKHQIVSVLNEIAAVSQRKNAEKKSLEASTTLDFLKMQLPLIKEALADAEYRLNKYRAESGKINIEQQAKLYLEYLTELDKKLAGLRSDEIEMKQRYTDEHPVRIALNSQITEIEKERAQMEQKIKMLPEADQIALSLMREVKVKSGMYTNILNRIQELEVTKAGTISDVRILALAKVPLVPLPSKTKLILIGSFLCGLMLSFAIVFGRRMLFPRVQDPHWTENNIDLPNLAVIPYAKAQKELLAEKDKLSKQTLPLLAKINPRDLSIEAIRSIRTSLQICMSCAKNNIVTLLGIAPGVGKSFLITNLAYLLATSGKKVLLMDGDLRKGVTHKYYDIKPSPGLSELIQGKCDFEQAHISSCNDHLHVIPRGEYHEDPAELLSSLRFKELVQFFSKQYDIVLIDTPPILLVTDAILISSIAAINYLIIGADVHRPEEIALAAKRLRAANIPLSGSLFNCNSALSNHFVTNNYYYAQYYDDVDNTDGHRKKEMA